MWVKMRNKILWESSTVLLLSMAIGDDLKFEKHLSELCKKAKGK